MNKIIANIIIRREKNVTVLKKTTFFDLSCKRERAFFPWKRKESPYKNPIPRPMTNDKRSEYEII